VRLLTRSSVTWLPSIDSYAGKLPIEFWTAVERFRQFVQVRKELCGD